MILALLSWGYFMAHALFLICLKDYVRIPPTWAGALLQIPRVLRAHVPVGLVYSVMASCASSLIMTAVFCGVRIRASTRSMVAATFVTATCTAVFTHLFTRVSIVYVIMSAFATMFTFPILLYNVYHGERSQESQESEVVFSV